MEFELTVKLSDDASVRVTYDPTDHRQIKQIEKGLADARVTLGVYADTVHTFSVADVDYEVFYNGDKAIKVHKYIDDQLAGIYISDKEIEEILSEALKGESDGKD